MGESWGIVWGLQDTYARGAGSVTVPRRMAARKVRRDVTGRVREPGFTPGVRDVPAIVLLLGTRDEELARDAERALVRVGPTVVPIVRAEAQSASAEVRARLVRVVGALLGGDGASDNAEAIAGLIAARRRGEGKGARYAATALGKVRGGTDVAERALLEAWARSGPIELRRVLADALGKVGTAASAAALRECRTDDPELKRLVSRALLRVDRTAARSETSAIDGGASLERPWPIVFRCRAGLESVLVDELGDGASALRAARSAPGVVSPRATEEGRVQAVLRGPLSSARVARTAISFALLLGPESGKDEGALVRDLLASDAAWRIFRTFTRGPIRFRLAFESGGHRRGFVHRVAEEVRALRPEVMNDPTESSWEALVREHREPASGRETPNRDLRSISIELEPRALPDERFAYRVSDVPAASHPTIAAALARIGEARPDDVVWDPFVGSALELIERARLGPYAALHGTDIDEGALEAARANLARAGVEGVHLVHADSTLKTPKGVTLVLTNPPMGRRVARGELAPLVDRFVHAVAGALVPGGRLVWLSPMPERSRARLEAEGFTIDLARPVDMGGFRAELQRATKPRTA